MPRYHFNVFDGHREPDEDGMDLPDLGAARRRALQFASEILDDAAHREKLGEDWHMETTDANGLVLFRLDFHVTDAPVIRDGGGKSGNRERP